ncbi:DUF2088 domain-containing protein [candidate division KSB3 bacterium]|uniref:DUF2088 domain-containing protein n=1 Tax=candidate division KSB3 bacterium TaxID=2044937 RepID=A0A9D5JSM3_9BACT|nr:DUF2088 domain-containing protein [candidate division KSB3 bacterium]
MDIFDTLLDPIFIPRVIKVRQHFERPVIEDLEAEFLEKLHQRNMLDRLQPGWRVAIAVGSRGISNQPLLVKLLVQELKKRGADPFIVPAMGSHGGATAEGQKAMLIGMGFSEAYLEAPIYAAMEVVQVGETADGLPASVDKYAHEADAIVIVNRIKPHVAFRGPYESGLMKMISIGLGKQRGAEICHNSGFGNMAENIPAIGRVVLQNTNIVFAVGLIENGFHETCQIEVLPADEIESQEPALLEKARSLSQRLYFDNLDVLIIDEIGKDISGTGFDTNVVGRYHTPYATGGPQISRIAILDLTEKSHGNANGLGIVDFTTRRVFDKFEFAQTYPNSLTSTVPLTVKIPMVLKHDRHAFQAAIKTCNILNQKDVRLVRIKNTISLSEIEVSENLRTEVANNPNLDIVGEPYALPFDDQGNLL